MTSIILVIEQDENLHKNIKQLLLHNNFIFKGTTDEESSLEYLKKNDPDIIIFDHDSLNKNNDELYKKIKEINSELPIILLVSKETTVKMPQLLDKYADDFITKPFDNNELITRIRVHLRKQKKMETIVKIADLELDASNMEVKRQGKLIQLTPQEFKLLQYFMSNTGRILTREMILARIWMYSSDIKTRVVDVYIGYLRKKIDEGYSKKLLHSIRGFGYVLKE